MKKLPGNNKKLPIIIIALCALIALAMMAKSPQPGTTFGVYPTGTQALFELFTKKEMNPSRWFYSYRSLDKEQTNTILFVLEPASVAEEAELLQWVANGNTLVFADSNKVGKALLAKLGYDYITEPPNFSSLSDKPSAISFHCKSGNSATAVCENVRLISEPSSFISRRGLSYDMNEELTAIAIDGDNYNSSVIAGSNSRAAAVLAKHGKGNIWFFSGAELFLNQQIDRFDNLRLAYQLAENHQEVYFDEFHHGFTAPVTGTTRTRIALVYLFLGILVAWLLISTLSRSVRFGPPTPLTEVQASTNVEFVRALGLLYADNNATEKLSDYLDSWRRDISAYCILRPDATNKELLDQLSIQGVIDGATNKMLEHAFQTISSPEGASKDNLQQAVNILENVRKEALAA